MIFKKPYPIILIILISVLSFFFYSYRLSEVPSGIYVDESTSGFNAYSILKTGKDEYGKEFPIAFRFFGSYTPPLFVYLTTIPVWIFGLNEFSVRIISVICASLMILIVYSFLKESDLVEKKVLPLLLILFIITPWNFFFARTGYELYLGLFLFYLGALSFWLGLKRKHLLLISLPILSIATYASHPQIYTVPVFIMGVLLLFFRKINKKYLFLGFLIALIIQIPHLLVLNTKVFTNKNDLFYLSEIISKSQDFSLPPLMSVPLSFIYLFSGILLTYFSPKSLFFLSDPDFQRSIPELSVFYGWMVIPYLIGIYILFKNKKSDYIKYLILIIVVSVIPASFTRSPFNTQRALNLLMPLFIVISFGLSFVLKRMSYAKILIIFLFLIGYSLVLLWRSYFVLLPSERAVTWNYGFKQLSNFIQENPNTQFLIDQSRSKPFYIELAFFQKTDPRVLQKAADPRIKIDYYNFNDFSPDYKFENIDIRNISWENDIYKKQIIIGDELAISENQAIEHFLVYLFTISDPSGYPIFKAFETNPDKKCQSVNFKSVFCQKRNSNTINK